MVRFGRLRPIASSIISRFIYILTIIKIVDTREYGVPIEIKLWDSKRSPSAHMVDVTNEFGLKVLAEHNFLNDNNIAFSPYGLMGILVALYEGVDGESSYQIQRSMQLPWNRNVMRIGFRDIHRTLKTYFVPEEGFLAGLALNNENVTFNESYKKILRFYGFDLDGEHPSSVNNSNNNTQATTTDTNSSTVTGLSTTIEMTTETVTGREDPLTSQIANNTKEETTLNPNAETITNVDIRGPDTTTTISPITQSTSSASSMEIYPANDEITQTTDQATTLVTSMATESVEVSTVGITDITGSTTDINTELTTSSVMDTTTSTMDSSITNSDTTTNTQMTESETSPASTLATQETESTTLITETSTLESTTVLTTSALETLERKKKSVGDYIFTKPPFVDDYLVYRSFDVGIELPEKNEEDDKMFLVNGQRNIQVTYMQYDSVLEHAYLPHLEASAIRLPLDSERYYLLVILPSRRGSGELARLLARMARESDLSDVYAALHPRRVRAVVPSFIVKGHVALTTDLQKLGIHDVFEPRQHDFTPMTPQTGVYVRSIEQAVSVAIRKYQPDVKNRYVTSRNPVTFSATHPFLYFVMDANIHVALMAGKMVDPLNTRIL
ncbi:serpin H1 [Nymphalis io]|uniref:serpin H1 n=1 Tax=Inachis io TaxID=171585 RepID=UPI0021697893|nr:serpin H1 [Nymphalis io]